MPTTTSLLANPSPDPSAIDNLRMHLVRVDIAARVSALIAELASR
ncbi:hypothetical protein ACLQ3K_07155 [Tsukamurella sp. DT100]